MYVGDIARTLALAPSTVSYHLRILEGVGLVECHRQGRYRLYATTDARWAIISETELDDLDAGLPAPAAMPIRP
jgi:DNA-binding transcriptional ArsR family regulator